ncbi:M-phase phosphoprotein 6 [Orussus abietinus]|uniref:M-phase phosphoprotein 6 n=1 Tax=Orussus abietinus TaxID=222816 RepID=UPI000626B9E6|nr:M-phase phosphoprotein 6 [Orussus abietinus]
MSKSNTSTVTLSKGILEMKFMKKTKEKVEKQLYQEEGEEYFGSHLTTCMKQKSGKFIIEPSYVFCENLIDGRVSFNGMNPEIERLMELEQETNQPKAAKEECDVSDEQMAKCLILSKENSVKEDKTKHKNKKRSQEASHEELIKKKPKFLKPMD